MLSKKGKPPMKHHTCFCFHLLQPSSIQFLLASITQGLRSSVSFGGLPLAQELGALATRFSGSSCVPVAAMAPCLQPLQCQCVMFDGIHPRVARCGSVVLVQCPSSGTPGSEAQPHYFFIQNPDGSRTQHFGVPPSEYQQAGEEAKAGTARHLAMLFPL